VQADSQTTGAPGAPKVRPDAGEALSDIFNEVSRDSLVRDLQEMISIPSVNPFDDQVRQGFREREMAAYYCDRMSEFGLQVGSCEVAPGRPNVWGVMKGRSDGPSLMLAGHLDTVGMGNYPDAFVGHAEDGRVYGRGSCDMKAGLAGYLEVVRVISEAGIALNGDLVLTGIVDEEHQMIGSRHLGQYGPWADYGIIGEPTDLVICPAHKGQLGYYIRTSGQAVHSSKPEEGVNAIEAMSHVIEALRGYGAELREREAHALCGHGRYCPSVIQGGTILSTVPDYCQLEVDRRTLPGETKDEVLQELHAVLEPLARANPDFSYEITGPTLEIAPLDIPLDTPVVETVTRAYREIAGQEGNVRAFYGGTDAPNFGFPTLVFGPGSVAQAHSLNEYVEIDDLEFATKVYLGSVLDLLAAK